MWCKKGDIFPGFDDIAEGDKVDGRLWESDSGKQYLFAPKGGAKAPVRQATQNHASNASNTVDDEYPISDKLETILNKLTGITLQVGRLEDALIPKKKERVVEEPNFDEEPF